MYYLADRSIAIVKPKLPMLNWINSSFDNLPTALTLDSIRIDCNSYLIPEIEEIEDGINFIDSKFAEIFTLELSSWTEDKSIWPTNRTLAMFWEWFDVEVSATTLDITEMDESDIEADQTIH